MPKTKNKILLVEDDALLAKALVDEIVSAGFSIISISNGLEAIDVAKSKKPDLILLDLILPGLDGFEILKQLKADKKMSQIPVFVVSNLGASADVKSAKALGADEYFIKANVEIDRIIKAMKRKLS